MAPARTAKKRPRRKNTGGLYQRKDGMWCAAITLPSPDGQRRRKVIARARKDDALAELNKALDDLRKSGDLPTASPTLAAWLELWFTRIASKRLKVSTRPAYRSKIDNYIVPAIGRVRLDRLNTSHIYRLHEYIEVDRGLSATTALQAHRILAKALTDAEREGRVSRNVAKLVDAPRKAVVKIPHLTNEQHKVMVMSASARSESEAARWIVAFQSGLRPGERLGLTADELLFDRHIIRVAWQLQRLTFVHGCDQTPCGRKRAGNCPQRRLDIPSDQEMRHLEGGLYLTRPKSKAGWREVPMTEAVEAALRWHVETYPPGQEGLVFTRDGQRPIDPSDDAREWKAALEDAGLPHVRRHSSRHTCATVLDELGIPDNVRLLIIGHADKETTALYTHVADERMHDAMRQLGAAMDYR